MSGKIIATIYFYLISAGAIILMVIGVFNIVSFILNSTMYEKYPLKWGGISNCESVYPKYDGGYSTTITAVAPDRGLMATPSAEQIEKDRKYCLENEEAQRTQHKVDNIRDAITFSLVGLVLFGLHFPQAKKRSN